MKTSTIRAMSFASYFLIAFVVVSALMTPAAGRLLGFGIAFLTPKAKAVVFAVHGTCLALWLVFRLVAWLYRKRLADDDRAVVPRSAFGRFYRFMSASSVKTETFSEGFDMRAFKVRRILIILWLILFFGGIWAFDNSPKVTDTSRAQIGVLIFLLLPLIVPIFALLGTRLVMMCSSRSTGRPALAFAIAYVIVYAAFLISAPIRPLPLDPPLPELMAKIHPCLLDENGNVRAPKTIVVDGVRTVDDVMNVVTNSGRPEFQVAAAFLAFQDRFAETSDALVDFERLAKTNIVEKANLEAFPEIGQRIAELERLLEIAAVAQGPQFGPGDVVPAFASSRRDYVWRDRSESLPESCYAPLWAARDERDLVHAVSLVQHTSDAFFNSLGFDYLCGRHNRMMAGAVLSMSERLAISAEGADAIRQAFGGGSAEEMCLRKHVQDADLGFAAWAPASGTSYWKALRAAFNRSSTVPFCWEGYDLQGYDLQKVGIVNSFLGVLWSPVAAALCGYDVDAQLATMKARRQWVAVAASCALDADRRDRLSEAYRHARFAIPFCRGGLWGIVDEKAWRRLVVFQRPRFELNFLMARYGDASAIVADVALRLSQFRGEKGRDAASLDEVEEALGWKPEADSDLEVFYEPIPAPEGAAEGAFAYALGLKPKAGCRKAFENTGDAWLVVRNPNFAGTLKRRFFNFQQYGGQRRKLDWEWRVTDEADKDTPFALPAALFCDDPAALEEAEHTMSSRGWGL